MRSNLCDAEQEFMRSAGRRGAAGPTIEQVGRGVESLCPEASGHVRMTEKHTNTVVDRAENSLVLAVLLTGVWAGETEVCAVASKQRAHSCAVEFTTIARLQCKYG